MLRDGSLLCHVHHECMVIDVIKSNLKRSLMGEAYPIGGNSMKWYVGQVRSGHERKIVEKCRTMISKDVLQDCFIPEYIRKKKYMGSWHDVKDILFKGYIFMITDQIDQLNIELKKIPDFVKVIGKKKADIFPLNEEEVAFMKSFGKENHVVEMSTGFIQGEQIFITEGPLQGKEGQIIRIDRHKRVAYLQLSMFNKDTTTKVGLEIISKC